VATTKISYYRNDATGVLAPPHWLGTTEDGRNLYCAVEGWTPVNEDGSTVDVECGDGGRHWIPATEGEGQS
jgi:hypothetical protein